MEWLSEIEMKYFIDKMSTERNKNKFQKIKKLTCWLIFTFKYMKYVDVRWIISEFLLSTLIFICVNVMNFYNTELWSNFLWRLSLKLHEQQAQSFTAILENQKQSPECIL